MAAGGEAGPSRSPEDASHNSYVLKKLVEVPLSADGESQEAEITCVELCGRSLIPLGRSKETAKFKKQ